MNPSVLIVENDPTLLDQLCLYVKEAEFRVHCATNAETALTKLQQHRLPIVILDWELPENQAAVLVQQVRENHRLRRTHILVLSSQTDPAAIETCMNLGTDDFFTKPVGAAELRNRIIWASNLTQSLV